VVANCSISLRAFYGKNSPILGEQGKFAGKGNYRMDGLFHYQVGLPYQPALGNYMYLRYSRHACNAAKDDRYGSISLPDVIVPDKYLLIEMEVRNGQLCKVVLRGTYCARRQLDIVLVINPTTCNVITCWLNKSSDAHSTLQRGKYTQIPKGYKAA
jgi:hypothetical protein